MHRDIKPDNVIGVEYPDKECSIEEKVYLFPLSFDVSRNDLTLNDTQQHSKQ